MSKIFKKINFFVFVFIIFNLNLYTYVSAAEYVIPQILYNITGQMTSDYVTNNGVYEGQDVTSFVERWWLDYKDSQAKKDLFSDYYQNLKDQGYTYDQLIDLYSKNTDNSNMFTPENRKIIFEGLKNDAKRWFPFLNIDNLFEDLFGSIESLDTDEAKQAAIDAYWENYIANYVDDTGATSDVVKNYSISGFTPKVNGYGEAIPYYDISSTGELSSTYDNYYKVRLIGYTTSSTNVSFSIYYKKTETSDLVTSSVPFLKSNSIYPYYDKNGIYQKDKAFNSSAGSNEYIGFNPLNMSTNIPYFSSSTEAIAYFNGTLDISHAVNYKSDDGESVTEEDFRNYVGNRLLIDSIIEKDAVSDEDEIAYYTALLKAVLEKLPENYTDEDFKKAAQEAFKEVAKPGEVVEPGEETENPPSEGVEDSKVNFTTLFSWLSKILSAIIGLPDKIFSLFEKLIIQQIALIVNGITDFKDSVIEHMSNILSGIDVAKTALVNILQTALGIAEDMGLNIDVLQNILDVLRNLKVIDVLLEGFTNLLQAVKDFANSVSDGFAKACENVEELADVIAIGFEDMLEWAKSAGKALTDIWDRLGEMAISIPDIIAKVIEWIKSLINIGELINVKLGEIADFLIINPALIIDAIEDVENPVDLAFAPLKIILDKFKSISIEYPKITMNTPPILKQFYKQDVIVFVDFEDWKTQCAWVRSLLNFSFWLGFAYSWMKRLRPALHIG